MGVGTVYRHFPTKDALVSALFAAELDAWVHGTDDLPLADLLDQAGVSWQLQPGSLAQRLGLKVSESALTGIKVSQVMRGSVAETCGFAPGDEVLALGDWRLRRLDDALRLALPGEAAEWLVSRDQRLHRLTAVWPAEAGTAGGTVLLGAATSSARPAAALRKAWLGG